MGKRTKYETCAKIDRFHTGNYFYTFYKTLHPFSDKLSISYDLYGETKYLYHVIHFSLKVFYFKKVFLMAVEAEQLSCCVGQ